MDWKDTIKAIAPTLGLALGGPFGAMASKVISEILLGKKMGSVEEITDALISATPDKLLELKKADNEFKITLEKLGVEIEKIHAEDRASARRREEVVGGYSNPILASVIIGGFFAIIWFVFDSHADLFSGAQAGIAGTLVGYVSAKADQVVGYYFGTSRSSDKKTDILARGAGGK